MRIRARLVWPVVAGLAVLAIAIAGPRVLRRAAFFRVRQVEVVGNRYLDPADVVRRLGLGARASTLDPLAKIRAAARAIPGVVDAVVVRRLPATLRVTVTERVPVALTPDGNRLGLIDNRGHLLPFDPVRAPASLPIASRDSFTAALLGRLRLADPLWYDSVQTARLEGHDVLLDTGGHRIRFDVAADGDVMRGVIAVRHYLATRAMAWTEIDARYAHRVFVRKAAS